MPELRSMLVDNCSQSRDSGPMADVAGGMQEDATTERQSVKPAKGKKKGGLRRDQGCVVRDTITALALCHNVTPTFPSPENKQIVEYQASSPDEIALVKFAESLDMRLMERDQNEITIQNAVKNTEKYSILANFPFSSDTKRMGIVVRHNNSGRIIFYLKGAETVMKNKVRPNQRVVIDESCDNLANEGLRTLVISQKLLQEEQFNEWQKKYDKARAELVDREQRVAECIE